MSALRGVRDVLRWLRRMPTSAELARRDTIDTWADEMKATAKRLAPIRTGRLRNNIESRVNYSAGKAWVGVWDHKTMEYAYYVEKGTSSMREQPYLGPAAQMHQRTLSRELRRNFRRHVGR